jgi:hypothetical protein
LHPFPHPCGGRGTSVSDHRHRHTRSHVFPGKCCGTPPMDSPRSEFPLFRGRGLKHELVDCLHTAYAWLMHNLRLMLATVVPQRAPYARAYAQLMRSETSLMRWSESGSLCASYSQLPHSQTSLMHPTRELTNSMHRLVFVFPSGCVRGP